MSLNKSLLLGSATALLAVAGAQAADLPGRKSAPVEYVKVCDAYGAGFFFIPGTQTCLKVGGYVRVDYDYRPARPDTANTGAFNAVNSTTSGFYNRGAISADARTQTAYGTVQTFMRLRLETGSGPLARAGTTPSLEAAYIRFAGFSFGQASQPFAFMSSWAFNTHYWTGWPNGVRQLAYTHTFGGGFSATVAATDSTNYNAVSGTTLANTPGKNGIVWVGNVRYDQSWGSAQIMGAWTNGGDVYSTAAVTRSGYAVGAGLAVNLPMLAAGDRIELSAVYADRLANLLADATLNTPSAAAYGSNPLGGPAVTFANGSGYSLAAQMRHYWSPTIRSQVYASYTSRKLHDGVYSGVATVDAKGTAYSLGHGLIWSPTAGFDIGLELTYLRASYNQAAVRTVAGWTTRPGSYADSAFIGKLRVQRDF
ncbi:MAG: hypothetical protein JWN93_2233 [Hyphomicrobiales bacterium]|nr:hypothetical protein [Hyphomicrobiales bacterium]